MSAAWRTYTGRETPLDRRAVAAGPGLGERVVAPLGRRRAEVVGNMATGGYRIFSAIDPSGPEPAPGQFYMLAAERGWGEGGERPYLPRAFSVAEAEPVEGGVRLDFLVEDIGPGTGRLARLEAGEGLMLHGPLGRPFSAPAELNPGAAGAIVVGGGIGIAPLAILRRRLADRGVPARTLLGFRDRAHSGGLELFRCCEVRLASEDGHAGHRGYVTELLAVLLEGNAAETAAIYACGPPGMLEAVRMMCAERGVPAELAMEAPMACGFGACFGCAVPLAAGGYMRLCVDGPVIDTSRTSSAPRPSGATRPGVRGEDQNPGGAKITASPRAAPCGGAGHGAPPVGERDASIAGPVDLCGLKLAHPIVNGSGTFDAIAARRAFGDELYQSERFPFSAFVSKTITPEPRAGNPPPRLWEEPAGMINSIGLPNKGLDGFLEGDLPQLAELPVPLIVSVMGTSIDQFIRLVEGVAGREEVAAIELNVSCPNVHSGLIVGEQPSETAALLAALRPLTPKPLIVKLTPNVADPAAVARAAEEGGADAVSLINTLKATALDPADRQPWLGGGSGGLSGPAVRAIALKQVSEVAEAVTIAVIGMGGVERGAHARDLLAAGARVVAVGTASFRDPLAAVRILDELDSAEAPVAAE